MKIIQVCPYYYPTICGVGQVVRELSERYVKQGHEVHVFCSDSGKKDGRIENKYEIINGVHIHRLYNWFTLINFACVYPSLFPALLKSNSDLIHSHVSGHLHYFLSSIASKIKNIPHVHTTHCPFTEGFRSLFGRIAVPIVYRTLNRISYGFTDKIVAITPWELPFLKKYGANPNKTTVIRNGMDSIISKIIPNNQFRKKYSIRTKYLVLFFARLNPTKGPDKFILTAKEILKERKDITFILVGPDEGMLDTVKQMIKNETLIKYFEPIREKKLVAEMYQASDIYVLPSYREGLPLTLFEAMSAGLPIIASPVNGVPYEMKSPDNGFFVNYGNIPNLKKGIIQLIDNKSLREKISKNNREKAKLYDWDSISKEYLKLYKSLISKNKKA